MREIVLDGAGWKSSEDVYGSFLSAVGAPSWHGHNFNALRDSIATGRINEIEVPYVVVVKRYGQVAFGAEKMASYFVDLIRDLRNEGCPVDIRVEP